MKKTQYFESKQLEALKEAIQAFSFRLDEILDKEPDAEIDLLENELFQESVVCMMYLSVLIEKAIDINNISNN